MKKLLTFFMSSGLIAPTVSGVVACMAQDAYNPKTIGTGIDKSKAFDDSVKDLESGFTNYYIVGDSLSDVDGVSSYLGEFAGNLLTNVASGLSLPINIGNINVNVMLDGDGYGFVDDEEEDHSAFSNGATAGYLLGKQLGFTDLRNSNYFGSNFNETDGYGNNYAIGGATAASMEGITGTLLNNVTIDKQTVTLLEQHVIGENDLTFFEIGGNDLFAMIDDFTNTESVDRIFKAGVTSIKTGMYNLLNNGMGKILFMTPPKMDQVPKYVSLFENPTDENKAKREFILSIGEKYEQAILEVVKEIQKEYPDRLQMYDLYSEFANLLKHFKDEEGYTVNKAFTQDSGGMLSSIKAYIPGWNDEKIADNPMLKVATLLTKPEYHQGDYKNSENLVALGDVISTLTSLMGSRSGLNLLNSRTNTSTFAGPEVYLQLVMLANKAEDQTGDINKYFFTDFVHPTATVHQYVADLMEELLTKNKTTS